MAKAKHNLMPGETQVSRRTLMAAAPAAGIATLIAGAVPGQAMAETPVMRAYREWREFSNYVNGPATKGFSDDAIEALADRLTAFVGRVIAAPSQCDLDLVLKFLTAVEDYQLFYGLEPLEGLEAEARALVGA